jgi:predicted outer membrane repeat protein
VSGRLGAALLLSLLAGPGAATAPPPARAAVIRVPATAPSVGQALAAATDGDSVLVSPGTWSCSAALGDGVALVGDGPEGTVVLDAGGQGAVLRMADVGGTTMLINLVLTGGTGVQVADSRYGGGLYAVRSSPAMSHVRITGCMAPIGGGAYFEQGLPELRSCSFDLNRADFGGGLALNHCLARLDSCTLTGNAAESGGGILAVNGASLAMQRGALLANSCTGEGGGAYFLNSTGTLQQMLLKDNSAASNGGGISCGIGCALAFDQDLFYRNHAGNGGAIYAGCGGGPTTRPLPTRLLAARSRAATPACSQVQLLNNTLFENTATVAGAGMAFNDAVQAILQYNVVVLNSGGSGIHGLDLRATLDLRCNDVWHNQPTDWGGSATPGNSLSVNPLFCDPLNGVFTLCTNSVLNSPVCGIGPLGAFGAECDPCAGLAPARVDTWGRLKHLYVPRRGGSRE